MCLVLALIMFITGLTNGSDTWLIMSTIMVVAGEIGDLTFEIRKNRENREKENDIYE
jgi:hypothetical protein